MSDLTDEQREWAKNQYLVEHMSITDIAKKLDVGRTSVSYYANKYWKKELDMMKAELFARFTSTKRMHFTKMSESSIKIIARSLEALANRDNPPSVMEAAKATQILESLDKITRLDDGSPTDIVAEKPISIKEIESIIDLNPFTERKIEDVEYKEISTDDSDGGDISDPADSH
jgi:predicted DNA-binding protein YlxM (UPF0122 family)